MSIMTSKEEFDKELEEEVAFLLREYRRLTRWVLNTRIGSEESELLFRTCLHGRLRDLEEKLKAVRNRRAVRHLVRGDQNGNGNSDV